MIIKKLTLVLQVKLHFFGENCDHNIDPRKKCAHSKIFLIVSCSTFFEGAGGAGHIAHRHIGFDNVEVF
jgi:hypothetical protein